MGEDEQGALELKEDREEGPRRGPFKTVIVVLVIALILLIALGFIRYWMVSSYGGW